MPKNHFLTASDLAMDQASIKRSFAGHIEYSLAKDEYTATIRDYYRSIAYSARDRLCDRWNQTRQRHAQSGVRNVYYLSLEYLVGRLLDNALLNLGITEEARAALAELDLDLDEISRMEDDPGLGNGGLGRLAACFLDSMANLDIAAIGYGIRYEYGIFRQAIIGGEQHEQTDTWLRYPNPWEVPRPEVIHMVRFGGRVQVYREAGRELRAWVDTDNVMAMAYDTPVPGYRNGVVNTMRLWAAKATRDFDVQKFSRGDYVEAVYSKISSEHLARVLYPNDQVAVGRELRLKQEFFFVSATLQDVLKRHFAGGATLAELPQKAVFQLNDTHPAVAVAELMRLLLDEHAMSWEAAWDLTTRCFAYTNHTVLPEALEEWPLSLFERVLPRHLEIIYEINRRLLDEVRHRFGGDADRIRRMSLIGEDGGKRIRMAHLAIVGSYSINGVSALHSRILRERLFVDFAHAWPEKFRNETNGITPRRWLRHCNPWLSQLITARIGDGWVRDLDQLQRLVPHGEDVHFRAGWHEAKQAAKVRLATWVQRELGVRLDAKALFDVQVKRIHEYKRQTLALLHTVALHRRIKLGGKSRPPRVVIFAGKAAPGYWMAKRIIRLINDVAAVINADDKAADLLKVVFLPNYGVSLAELIMPAADLSEQISTAGTEASGTGNMKLSLNGALTIGTLDGANLEILEAVGHENMFIFGMDDRQVEQRKAAGYDPRACYRADAELAGAIDALLRGDYARGGDATPAREVVQVLMERDPFLVLADFAAYRDCQLQVETTFRDVDRWTRMSIANVAHMGRFSSDATIAGYARDIWRVPVADGRPLTVVGEVARPR
jgi:starch phosphorylase